MVTRTRAALAASVAAIAVAVAAPAAQAVDGTGTTATMTLTTGGSLSISEPAGTTASPKSLGSTASQLGTWTSGALGTVTVSDTRAGLLSNVWTATAAVTDFTYVGTPPEGATSAQTTIPAASMLYNVGTATPGTENAVGSLFAPTGGAIAANIVTVGAMTAVGSNSLSWSPTLTVTLTNQVAGTYRGTITHSVT